MKKQSGLKLGEIMKRAGEKPIRAKAKRARELAQAQLVVKTIALTPPALETLERFARELTGKTGRKTSASAIVRALLRHAEKNIPIGTIGSLVESETASGEVVWGKVATP